MSKGQKAKASAAAKDARPAGPSQKAKGKQKQRDSAVLDPSSSSPSKASAGRSQMDLPDDDLMTSIKGHNEAFTALLSLIPADLYVAREDDDDVSDAASEELSPQEMAKQLRAAKAEQKRKRGQHSKAEAEAAAAEKRAHLQQAKRAKLDPDNFRTPIELQEERTAQRAERQAEQIRRQRINTETTVSDEGAGDTDSGSDSSIAQDDDSARDSVDTPPTSAKASDLAAPTGSKNSATTSALPMQPPNGALDLRARLQAKIQAMQASRRAAASAADSRDGSFDDDDMSTASTRDELLEERRRKRGEMRDRRRKAAKERKRAERDGGQQNAQDGNAAKGGMSTANAKANHSRAPELLVPDAGRRPGSSTSRGNDVAKGDITFSSLHFDEDEHGKKRANKHALPSDPKAALAILEARKRKDEARKEKAYAGDDNQDAAAAALEALKERADRERWSKAEAAAQGVKIRDDTDLLRKAAKKRDKVKEKSTSAWKERARNLEEEQAARQKKRNDNIQAKKERTKLKHQGKKSSSSSSKGGKGIGGRKMGGGGKAKAAFKARPGFEGRRSLPGGVSSAKKGGGKRK